MVISESIAKSIVDEIHDIINEDINFIDKSGIIIYSTDKKRISAFHEAGFICIKENKDIIVNNPNTYKGSKPGINMPVVFGMEVIGAIGITGSGKAIIKYSKIIKKMTEILIKENYNHSIALKNREGIKYYIEGLINGDNLDNEIDFSDQFKNKMVLALGRNIKSHISIEYTDKIYEILNKYLNNRNYIYAVFFNEIIIYSFNVNLNIFFKNLEGIICEINEVTSYNIKFGVSESFKNIELSKEKYEEANIALKWGKLLGFSKNLYEFKNFDLEILLTSVDSKSLNKYISKVLSKVDDKDIDLYRELIKSYVNNNGSLKKCAEELFVHKNTIQYRLNKLSSITGYNPRNFNDLIRLYIGFMITNVN